MSRQTDRKREEEAFLLLLSLLRKRLTVVLRPLLRPAVTGSVLAGVAVVSQASAALTSIHGQAAALGASSAVMLGGSAAGLTPQLMGQRVGVGQQAFLRGFAQDLAGGVYRTKAHGGRWLSRETAQDAIERRMALYAQRVRGTANSAWLACLPADTRVLWQLGMAEHCDDCLYESAQGWRDRSTLTRVPGDGSTECITNCRCSLVADVPGFGKARGF